MVQKHSFLNHHTIEMMKTALPYMNPQAQKSIEVLVKTEELLDTVHVLEQPSELSACNVNKEPFDMEAMLLQMKQVGTKKEQETIDSLLNFMKMQKLLQAYSLFINKKQTTDSNSETKDASGSQDTLMEFLMSQLSPEQKSNFENINLVLNAMNN
ncbi:hypothetical protein [Velocimicrobium porci]|uniref:Uncharacterized protein n=1 Tax=Velocimicrobium porci TaxID=2606634 RepID=A0A6L5XWJ2_9FIRM|nr:hypothetical protein [Velocimicrobium porci]MSS62393.1 hypothetical protein [Velocimicrobium porci]